MQSEATNNPPNLLETGWLAESVRISFFVPSAKHVAPSLSDLLGTKAEHISDMPGQGIKQQTFSFQNGRLVLAEVPGRVDLIYAARPSVPVSVVHIGDLQTALAAAYEIGKRFCKGLRSVSRMAIGPIAVKEVATEEEAAELVLQHNPSLPIDAKVDTDIFWQINKRRPASSFRGQINHLTKWQTITNQLLSGLVEAGVVSQTPEPVAVVHLVRVELDVNTAPRAVAEVFAERQADVYEELYERTRTLQERGTP